MGEEELVRESESYREALALKEEGNIAFKKGELKLALKNYSRMLIHLGMKPTFAMSSLGLEGGAINRNEEKDSEDDPLKKLRKDADELRKTCFNNISAVYAKLGDWIKSLEKAQKVLEMDEKSVKALFRVGVAYRNMKEYDKAKESLLKAQKLRDIASIRNELRRVDAAITAQRAKDDKKLRRAFKKAAAAEATKPTNIEDECKSKEHQDVEEAKHVTKADKISDKIDLNGEEKNEVVDEAVDQNVETRFPAGGDD